MKNVKSAKKNLKRVLNCIPSAKTEKDWTFNNAVTASVAKAKATLPDVVDLREKWWEINDQEQTGSCVGWATADGLLRWHAVKKGKIKNSSCSPFALSGCLPKKQMSLPRRPVHLSKKLVQV